MTRACFRWVRQLVAAVLLLALIVCALEVALRIRELTEDGRSAGAKVDLSEVLTPSAAVYETLRPFATVRTRSAELRQAVEFSLNSFGCRGPEPAVPRPSETVRILCLGGEHLFAATTPDELNFCHRLQGYLQGVSPRPIEILNGAVPGGSPGTQYLRLKHELASLQPDYVLLEVDPVFLARGAALQRWMRSDARGQPLASCHPTLIGAGVNSDRRRWREEFRVVDRLACLAGACLVAGDSAGTADVAGKVGVDSLSALAPLAELVQSWGGKLVVWSAPDLQQAAALDSSRLAQLIGPRIEEVGVPWCDVTVLHRDPTVIRKWSAADESAWTELGHQQLAEAVASFLLARVPGCWNGVYDRPTPVQPAVHRQQHLLK